MHLVKPINSIHILIESHSLSMPSDLQTRMHAARLNRAPAATCNLRRRIVFAHIRSSHPWHCHYTITRLNYLNAAAIILALNPVPEASIPNLRHPAAGRVLMRVVRTGAAGRGQHAIADIAQ